MKEKEEEPMTRMDTMGTASDSRTALEIQASRAEIIAKFAHKGQVDKTGADYIEHVRRVWEAQDDADELAQAVAWLHDVVEDTSLSLFDLGTLGFTADVIDAVDLLTRREPYNYIDYINRLTSSGNRLALMVKRADLIDHLNPNCPESLRRRYEVALTLVDEALSPLAREAGCAVADRLCADGENTNHKSQTPAPGAERIEAPHEQEQER